MTQKRIDRKPTQRNRNLIVVDVWPRKCLFEGKRIDPDGEFKPSYPMKIAAHPGVIELLIAEYKHSPERFEQTAARSLEAALKEWREELYAEDEETRDSANNEEVPPYGETTD